jgi:rRNA maturation endonuclease Nob1
MRTRRLPAIAQIALVAAFTAGLCWSLWGYSRTTTFASGFTRTHIGLLSRAVIDRPAQAVPGAPTQTVRADNVPALAGTIAITAIALMLALHFARQTWLNHGPRDQCCTCGARQAAGGHHIHCPRCGAWPNQRRSTLAFWRLFCTKASPLWRAVTGAGRTTDRSAPGAATDDRSDKGRAENLEITATCPGCGHDLHGNRSPRCPECGHERPSVAGA